jgi:hypothetical protein
MVRRVGDRVPLRVSAYGKVYYSDINLQLDPIIKDNNPDSVDITGKPNMIMPIPKLIRFLIIVAGWGVWFAYIMPSQQAVTWMGTVPAFVAFPFFWIITVPILCSALSRFIYANRVVSRQEVEATVIHKKHDNDSDTGYHKVYFTYNGLWGVINNRKLYSSLRVGSFILVDYVEGKDGKWYLGGFGHRG